VEGSATGQVTLVGQADRPHQARRKVLTVDRQPDARLNTRNRNPVGTLVSEFADPEEFVSGVPVDGGILSRIR
tara:strand:+ start:5162 stop:5380 length:219 start_codon:yes stop_codon:yes gene_type:complete